MDKLKVKVAVLKNVFDLINQDFSKPGDLAKALSLIKTIITDFETQNIAAFKAFTAYCESIQKDCDTNRLKSEEDLSKVREELLTLIKEYADECQTYTDSEIAKVRKDFPKPTSLLEVNRQLSDLTESVNGLLDEETVEETAVSIRTKLESLLGNERLSVEAIDGIQELISRSIQKANPASPGFQLFGGTSGIQLYVGGVKKGTAKTLNFVAGSNITLTYDRASGENTITISGTGSGGGHSFAYSEVPTGTVDGVNSTFTLANTPISGDVAVFLNGARQQSGIGKDYTISGGTITFANAPLSGSIILVDYQY